MARVRKTDSENKKLAIFLGLLAVAIFVWFLWSNMS